MKKSGRLGILQLYAPSLRKVKINPPNNGGFENWEIIFSSEQTEETSERVSYPSSGSDARTP